MRGITGWLEQWQVPLYLVVIALGAGFGLLLPAVAEPAEHAVTPVLGLLLYVTFLGVPFARLGRALRDWQFLLTVVLTNFVIAPLVVAVLARFVAGDQALLVGVVFVLLTPCVDYVIVFTGLAGGAQDRLLAAAPLLMLGQLLMLPLYLWFIVGAEFIAAVDFGPFAGAFVLLIVVPLAAAALTQLAAARSRVGAWLRDAVVAAMVPLMVLTLFVVVASQLTGVGQRVRDLLGVVPVFLAFAAVMLGAGLIAGRVARLDVPSRRAMVFSGVTRNSLVVLPLVLALPAAYDLAPLVVVTQTLVELLIMVVFIRLVPALLPATVRANSTPSLGISGRASGN